VSTVICPRARFVTAVAHEIAGAARDRPRATTISCVDDDLVLRDGRSAGPTHRQAGYSPRPGLASDLVTWQVEVIDGVVHLGAPDGLQVSAP
jgi:hypothetical protein